MKTTLLSVLYVIMIACYAANTSQLVLLASQHFKKNEKSYVHNRKTAGIRRPVNAVALTHTDHHRELRKTGGSTYLENRLIRLKESSKAKDESSRDDSNHDREKTRVRHKQSLGKKRGRKALYFRYGTITLASKQPATLYRNGKRLLDIDRTYGGYKFTRKMKIYFGDLLAVESKRTTRHYGVAIDVRLQVRQNKGRRIRYVHFNTQYEAGLRIWRGDGIPRKRWMTKRGQYCKLPKPTKVRNARVLKHRVKNAPPLDPKTRYVWVSGGKTSPGQKGNDRMVVPNAAYLILEVGMRCSSGIEYRRTRLRTRRLPPRNRGGNSRARRAGSSPRRPERRRPQQTARATQPPRRTQARRQPRRTEARGLRGQNSPQATKRRLSTSSMSSESKPEAAKNEEAYPPQCKCRAYPQSQGSFCYSMLKPGKPHGRCRMRQCGVSYQCIPGGGRKLRDCIRHVATYEVVLTDNSRGVLRCSYKKLRKPKVYYTLYQ